MVDLSGRVKDMKFYSTFKLASEPAKVHGCWCKTQTAGVRDEGLLISALEVARGKYFKLFHWAPVRTKWCAEG